MTNQEDLDLIEELVEALDENSMSYAGECNSCETVPGYGPYRNHAESCPLALLLKKARACLAQESQ